MVGFFLGAMLVLASPILLTIAFAHGIGGDGDKAFAYLLAAPVCVAIGLAIIGLSM